LCEVRWRTKNASRTGSQERRAAAGGDQRGAGTTVAPLATRRLANARRALDRGRALLEGAQWGEGRAMPARRSSVPAGNNARKAAAIAGGGRNDARSRASPEVRACAPQRSPREAPPRHGRDGGRPAGTAAHRERPAPLSTPLADGSVAAARSTPGPFRRGTGCRATAPSRRRPRWPRRGGGGIRPKTAPFEKRKRASHRRQPSPPRPAIARDCPKTGLPAIGVLLQ